MNGLFRLLDEVYNLYEVACGAKIPELDDDANKAIGREPVHDLIQLVLDDSEKCDPAYALSELAMTTGRLAALHSYATRHTVGKENVVYRMKAVVLAQQLQNALINKIVDELMQSCACQTKNFNPLPVDTSIHKKLDSILGEDVKVTVH